jgi:hypothetical protein
MMFPDTSNDQQLAALRHTAERFRAAGSSQVANEHETRKLIAPMREGINACPHSIGSDTPRPRRTQPRQPLKTKS